MERSVGGFLRSAMPKVARCPCEKIVVLTARMTKDKSYKKPKMTYLHG